MKQLEIIKKALPIIDVNFGAVKESLTAQLAKYEKIVVTEETLADCVSMQRELAGVRNKIDGMRLDIQREMKAPLDHFGGQMKELFQIVVDTEKPIKDGIAVFEEKRKAEKTEAINAKMDEAKSDLSEKFADKLVFNAKWLNKGSTMSSIEADIESQVADLVAMQDAYKETVKAIREIAATDSEGLTTPIDPEPFIAKADRGEQLTSIIIEINAAAKSRKESEVAAVEAEKKKKETIAPEPQKQASDNASTEPTTRTVTIAVTATDEKLRALSDYLKENRIAFEKIGD